MCLAFSYCVVDDDVRLPCYGHCCRDRLPFSCVCVCVFFLTLHQHSSFFPLCRTVGLCVADIFALCSCYRRIPFALFVRFIRFAVIFSYYRSRYRIVAVNLSCATGPNHRVLRLFCTTRGNILVCAYPVAVVRCELVRCVANCHPLSKVLYRLLSATSNVHRRIVFHVQRRSSASSNHTRDILLFIFILLIVLLTVLNLDIRSSF